MSTKVVTGEVRGSYVRVFKAKMNDYGKMEYSMKILIPKEDKKTLAAIEKAVKAAKELGKETKWGGKIPSGLKLPLRDGDGDDEQDGDGPDVGHHFMNVKNERQPGIVDRDRQEILDEQAFVSGDYCRVSINAYPFNTNGNKGVSFGLKNIQVLRKGEPLGGSAESPDDAFDDLPDNGGDSWDD